LRGVFGKKKSELGFLDDGSSMWGVRKGAGSSSKKQVRLGPKENRRKEAIPQGKGVVDAAIGANGRATRKERVGKQK